MSTINKLKTIVRHWRLFLPANWLVAVIGIRTGTRSYLRFIAICALLFLVPTIIGGAAGVAAYESKKQFYFEQALDSRGIPVTVNVISAHTWRYGEPPLSSETADRRFDVCYLDIEYRVPGFEQIYSTMLHPFGDPNNWIRAGSSGPSYADAPKHCAIFKTGSTGEAKVLPEDHSAIMLDFTKRSTGDRIMPLSLLSFVLITLPLGILFTGLIQYLKSSRL